VAIVNIGRIQVRRGRKYTAGDQGGTGIPQLASGEFGWAVDSQELYIGNGSVAEGAPYVGNTRILTENDIGSISTGTGGTSGNGVSTKTFELSGRSFDVIYNVNNINKVINSYILDNQGQEVEVLTSFQDDRMVIESNIDLGDHVLELTFV